MITRHAIPERCNRPAWRYATTNGYRLCWNDSGFVLSETMIGPCDYPLDGLGAARYSADTE